MHSAVRYGVLSCSGKRCVLPPMYVQLEAALSQPGGIDEVLAASSHGLRKIEAQRIRRAAADLAPPGLSGVANGLFEAFRSQPAVSTTGILEAGDGTPRAAMPTLADALEDNAANFGRTTGIDFFARGDRGGALDKLASYAARMVLAHASYSAAPAAANKWEGPRHHSSDQVRLATVFVPYEVDGRNSS